MNRSQELDGAMVELSRRTLAEDLPARWRHVSRARRQALGLRPEGGIDADLLAAAAVAHDIGYAPTLIETGFHPIDGARYLRREGVDERIVSLVAHHSCAAIEADLRDLAHELADFRRAPAHLAEALIYCDMTSGPQGELVTPEDRLAEILVRRAEDEIVVRFVELARDELLAASRRVEKQLAG